jgi:hypothetical protein
MQAIRLAAACLCLQSIVRGAGGRVAIGCHELFSNVTTGTDSPWQPIAALG